MSNELFGARVWFAILTVAASCLWLHCDAHARHMRTQNKRSSRRAELWILSTHVFRMGLVSGYHLRSSWNPGNSLQYWIYVERGTGSSDWAQWVWPDVVEKTCKPLETFEAAFFHYMWFLSSRITTCSSAMSHGALKEIDENVQTKGKKGTRRGKKYLQSRLLSCRIFEVYWSLYMLI